MRQLLPLALAAAALLGSACGTRDAAEVPADPPRPPGYIVDSALPIDTLLARFRATIPDTPTTLVGGESSPERLTRAYLDAVSAQDTAALRRLIVSRAEFAWLYYPHSQFTRRPYELGAELLWIQISGSSETGVTRMLRRYGGSRLRAVSVTCPDSALEQGPNRIIRGCRVLFAAADSAPRELRLFGDILARDGTMKFLSYSNDL